MGKIHKVVKAKWPHVTSVRPLAVRTAGENRTCYSFLVESELRS